MINLFDHHAVEAIAKARQERFLEEVEELRRARLYRADAQRHPGRVRRAVGVGLIRAGTRLSGTEAVEVRVALVTH